MSALAAKGRSCTITCLLPRGACVSYKVVAKYQKRLKDLCVCVTRMSKCEISVPRLSTKFVISVSVQKRCVEEAVVLMNGRLAAGVKVKIVKVRLMRPRSQTCLQSVCRVSFACCQQCVVLG